MLWYIYIFTKLSKMKKIFLSILFFCLLYNGNAQNIGIGTTSPGHKLTIEQPGGGKYNEGFEWTGSALALRSGTAIGLDYSLIFGVDTTHKASYIQSYFQGNGGRNLVINGMGGRVGIGTSTPSSSLNVNGQITVDQKNFGGYGGLLLKGNVPGSNYPNIAFTIKNNAATPADVVAAMIQGDLVSNTAGAEKIDLTFLTSATGLGGLSEKLRIKYNGNVGIGNNNPNAPLAFPASLGKKITLYPGATGDVGFAVAGNRLQIYADNPNADVAIGYDAAGVFNERFAVKPTGALALNGSTGAPGQVLISNGGGAAASWIGKPNAISFSQTGNSIIFPSGDLFVSIPGLDFQSFSITEPCNVVFNANLLIFNPNILYTTYIYTEVQFLDVNLQIAGTARAYGVVEPARKNNVNVTGMATLTPGFYTTRVVLGKDASLDANGAVRSEGPGKLILTLFPL